MARVLTAGVLAALTVGVTAQYDDDAHAAWGPEPWFTDATEGVVMGGADVVNYHGLEADAPVPSLGTSAHSVIYGGYTFWFLNASNAATFAASPTRYIPAWGGFCAWGIAREGTNGNPSAEAEDGWPWTATLLGPPCNPQDGWAIINGTLFCTINRVYMNLFLSQAGAQGVLDGNARWTTWFGSLTAGPLNTGCWPGSQLPACMNGKPFANRGTGVVMGTPPPPTMPFGLASTPASDPVAGGGGGGGGGAAVALGIAVGAAVCVVLAALLVRRKVKAGRDAAAGRQQPYNTMESNPELAAAGQEPSVDGDGDSASAAPSNSDVYEDESAA